jgi:hypothetical protein
MIPDGLEPLWVGDSATREWDAIFGTPYCDRLLDWMCGEGFSPGRVHRVEVYLLDAPFGRFFEYVNDEAGEIKLNEAGDDAATVIRTVLLSSLPPMKEEA